MVWGLGFGVWGLGFGVWGLGLGVWGLGATAGRTFEEDIVTIRHELFADRAKDLPRRDARARNAPCRSAYFAFERRDRHAICFGPGTDGQVIAAGRRDARHGFARADGQGEVQCRRRRAKEARPET